MFIAALDKVFPFRRLVNRVGPIDLRECSQREKVLGRYPGDWEEAQHPPCLSLDSCWTRTPCSCLKPTVLAQLRCLFLGGAHTELG